MLDGILNSLHQDDVKLFISAILFGYSLLFFFTPNHLASIGQIDIVIQSWGLGSIFYVIVGVLRRLHDALARYPIGSDKGEEYIDTLSTLMINLAPVLIVLKLLL